MVEGSLRPKAFRLCAILERIFFKTYLIKGAPHFFAIKRLFPLHLEIEYSKLPNASVREGDIYTKEIANTYGCRLLEAVVSRTVVLICSCVHM